ncbi:MAG: ABC transporter ATP-binding protein/permease [Oscillospiraceae bacterium]|nr:ABC transporter ATP-binding protein/permease [Oscillospiraceae bacterium]
MDKTVTSKKKKEKMPKPKYNMWQNSAYMVGLAWRNHKSVLGLVVAAAALGVVANLIGLYIAPVILGAIQTGVTAGRLITLILLFTCGLMVVYALTNYVNANTPFGRFAVRVKIINFIQQKAMITSYPNTESQDFQKKQDKAGMAISHQSNATEAIWNTLSELLKNIAGFVIYLLLLATLNPYIVLLVLVTSVVGFFVSNYLNGWGYRHRDEEAEYSRRMNYLTAKSKDHTLAKDIRIFGMREWLQDMYNSSFRLYRSFVVRGEKIYIWSNVVDVILTFARNGAAYLALIGLVLNQGLSAAQFLLYFSAVGGFTAWVGGILSGFSNLYKQRLEISVVREYLDYPEPFKFEDGEPLEPDTKKPYEIELKDVSYRYSGADKDTLEHINLRIKPGEKLAVMGLNGAGKTTLVKLICGFLDPTDGEVLLNGENIKKYNRRDVYRHFSAVFQDFSILAATVAENISQTENGIDATKVQVCADKSGITEKINKLPKKFDTNVGRDVYEDGTEFSGGETQRLMLARALYKDAPVIILDEPTAALDPIAESDMYNKYNDLTAGRTAVYISHRLASTRFCDRVIYIENGLITEEGTHESLIKQNGKYAELFEIQSHYYRKGVVENE